MSNTTEVSGKGIRDGSIQRRDIDITTTGESLITKLVAGSGISISSTGADSGTGEVTITATSAQLQANNSWLKWRNASNSLFLDNLKVDASDDLIINAEKYLDDPGTPGPDLAASNIFFQINKQNLLSLTSSYTLKFFPTDFLIHGITSDGADDQSITLTPADATTNFSTRGASVRIFGNEHLLNPGSLIIEAGAKADASLVLNAAFSNGQIQLKVANNDVLTVSPLLIAAKQNLTIPVGNVYNLPLSFTGDTNTGLFSSGADSLGLATGGQSRVLVNDTGLVGVAENNPEARLHVNTATSSSTGVLVKGATSQTANLFEAQDATGTVVFSVDPSGAISGTFSTEIIPELAPVATSGDYNDLINKPDLILKAEKGIANGVATLNASGQVPTSQLPSYVDDALEFANLSAFPVLGESGKIYVAIDTNKIYRWSGSNYIEISATAGNSDTATKLATARTIAATGDATWSVSFDGSINVLGALTLANSGVSAGTYTKLTVDNKGRATSGESLAASDIPSLDTSKITTGLFDAARIPSGISIAGNAATATKLATARTINGISFDGTSNITITANTPQFLTFGDGLTSDSFNGSAAKTLSVNSTVVRTSGNQTIDGTKTFSSAISGSVTGTSSNVTGTVAIANGGTGQITAQAAINALTGAASATSGYVLTRNASGNAIWQAPTVSSIAASAITGQTGMWTSVNRPGPYRLYRREDDSNYSVQTYWTGTYWRLYGYNGDTPHADTHVGYADNALNATEAFSCRRSLGSFRLHRQNTSSEGGQIEFSRALDDSPEWYVDAAHDGTDPIFRIFNRNAIGVRIIWGSNSWSTTSDERLKKNISQLSYGLNEIVNISPIRFDYTVDETNEAKRIGFSGQNVSQLVPEACFTDSEGMISLSSTELIPVLVNAVKELNTKVQTLETRIAALEALISSSNSGT